MTKRIAITMPDWMYAELEERAEQRSMSVPELIRRAVSFDQFIDSNGETLYIGEGKDRRQVVRP